MTAAQARALVTGLIADIAPDAAVGALSGGEDIAGILDLDSMDRANLVTAVSEAIGTDIPDRDAATLRTLDAWTAYLAAPGAGPSGA
jgi:hypothetical protein